MSSAPAWLCDPLLAERGVEHGFGVRGLEPPAGCLRPHQVHGIAVWQPQEVGEAAPKADAVVGRLPAVPVGVVTADCVPILIATPDAVAAVHAGWRGLAAGVVATALEALATHAADRSQWVAALGPHIGACCYEVDEPVMRAMREQFGSDAAPALQASKPGHAQLDLGLLVRVALERAGLTTGAIGSHAARCTHCDAQRFHSYRRDGPGAGRLAHYVTPPKKRA